MQTINPAGEDTLPLDPFYLEVGHNYTLVITNTSQDCVLEFQHGPTDATWHVYPNNAGVQAGGVVVLPFRCISGKMRVKFGAGTAADATVSCIPDATPQF